MEFYWTGERASRAHETFSWLGLHEAPNFPCLGRLAYMSQAYMRPGQVNVQAGPDIRLRINDLLAWHGMAYMGLFHSKLGGLTN